MQPGRTVLRYFDETQLTPRPNAATPEKSEPLLQEDALHDLRSFAAEFGGGSEVAIAADTLSQKTHLGAFIGLCRALGAVEVRPTDKKTIVRPSGRLGTHVPEILCIYLEESFTILEDWNNTHIIPEDSLSALEFLHQMELRRIEQERRAGKRPQPLAERPVAFVLFRAKNEHGEDCYLFEMNKDWRRLNFIGGKQELQDSGDYLETARREVREELGISPRRLTLTRLNDDPLVGYSLSGNVGSLARYPCVLYGAHVQGELKIRQMQDRWLTEATIREAMRLPDSPLMVNPVYLAYLLGDSPSRLSAVPFSTEETVRSTPLKDILPQGEGRVNRWLRVARENKDLLAAVITIVAALIGALLAFL